MPKLGINIDHVATLRQARREFEPDPVAAAIICEQAGADSIVAHLREDRRHINDSDIKRLKHTVKTKFNLEMSIHPEIVNLAYKIKPHQVTLVPEKRQEITTEGGLDIIKNFKRLKNVIRKLQSEGIEVSLFIDPVKEQLECARDVGATTIELHTGTYALQGLHTSPKKVELNKLKKMTEYGQSLGLQVCAGHGLNYDNVKEVANIKGMEELNIGHSIISYAVFVGLEKAVKKMIQLIK